MGLSQTVVPFTLLLNRNIENVCVGGGGGGEGGWGGSGLAVETDNPPTHTHTRCIFF